MNHDPASALHVPPARTVDLRGKRVGLVIIDVVNGFCTPGAGNLAPKKKDPDITSMVNAVDRVARSMAVKRRPILVFCDAHPPERPEPPYPQHCVMGTGEEFLVECLQWLYECPHASLVMKDCNNGFIGGMHQGGNATVEWLNSHQIDSLVVVGICTDICVLDFVTTVISARNHGDMLPYLKDVVVWVPGVSTYDLPVDVAATLELPPHASHPRDLFHRIGLRLMADRGAMLAWKLKL